MLKEYFTGKWLCFEDCFYCFCLKSILFVYVVLQINDKKNCCVCRYIHGIAIQKSVAWILIAVKISTLKDAEQISW